jgi:hypothetical protein
MEGQAINTLSLPYTVSATLCGDKKAFNALEKPH